MNNRKTKLIKLWYLNLMFFMVFVTGIILLFVKPDTTTMMIIEETLILGPIGFWTLEANWILKAEAKGGEQHAKSDKDS